MFPKASLQTKGDYETTKKGVSAPVLLGFCTYVERNYITSMQNHETKHMFSLMLMLSLKY